MPLTEADYKQQIIDEVGDTPSAVLATNIDRVWSNGDLEATLELHYLKSKQFAIRLVMGAERRGNVDSVGLGNVSAKLQQRMASLQAMLAETKTEYTTAIGRSGSYAGAVGQLETTAPVAPPTWSPDANSLDYAGNPYTTTR